MSNFSPDSLPIFLFPLKADNFPGLCTDTGLRYVLIIVCLLKALLVSPKGQARMYVSVPIYEYRDLF